MANQRFLKIRITEERIMRVHVLILAALTLFGFNAMAQNNNANNNTTNNNAVPSVTAQAPAQTPSGPALQDERFGIRPMVGYLSYQDITGATQNRGAAGLGFDINFAPSFGAVSARNMYLGISTGLLYSRTGLPGSDFWGSNGNNGANVLGANSDYIMNVPADLKIGYNFSSAIRISAHGGGNVIYRSNVTAMNLGTSGNLSSSSTNNGSAWDLFPNAGADLEVGLGRHVNLLVRPDWTFASSNTFFLGTVGLDFAVD
jgi:hypothetical protein